MYLAQDMLIDKLYLGDIEGKDEFDISNEKRIEGTYLNIDNIDSKFLSREKYYIYGHKGTGKTSLLRFIEYKAKQNNDESMIILFKEIKQDTLIYSTFKNLLAQVKDKNSAAIAFWQWFLLSLCIEKIFPNYDSPSDLIFNTQSTIFSFLSKFLVTIIKGASMKYGGDNFDTEITFSELTLNETNDIFVAGQKIRKLEKFIKDNLHKKVYILIDELETSKLSTSYEEDTILIKNLVLTVGKLNNLSKNLTIITAVRTEVLNSIFTVGDEVNKLLESKGEEIKWKYANYGIRHPLIKMVIKKLRYSMTEFYPKDRANIEFATEEEIFERWFPNKLLTDDVDGNNAKLLLHNTWIKPRDLVRFLQAMQKQAIGKKVFSRLDYDSAVKEYSEKAWTELKEELISIINEKEITLIETVFSNYYKVFFFDNLVKRFQDNSSLHIDEIKALIKRLYEIGFIGNNYRQRGKTMYRYSYRGDKALEVNERIEVHRGLWRNFSLKDNYGHTQKTDYSTVDIAENDFRDKLRGLIKT